MILYQKKISWFKRVRNFLNYRDDLKSLYVDTSESNIHGGWLLAIILWLSLLFFWYVLLKDNLSFLPEYCILVNRVKTLFYGYTIQ